MLVSAVKQSESATHIRTLWNKFNQGGELLYTGNCKDFPGGTVVKNLPANAGDTGSRPGLGRSHMPWSN